MNAVHHECVDLMKNPSSFNAACDLKNYTVEFKDVTFLEERNDILDIQNRNMFLLPTKSTYLHTGLVKPDLYLPPFFYKNIKPDNKVRSFFIQRLQGDIQGNCENDIVKRI